MSYFFSGNHIVMKYISMFWPVHLSLGGWVSVRVDKCAGQNSFSSCIHHCTQLLTFTVAQIHQKVCVLSGVLIPAS